jgi:putative ABC transport system permease protein
LIPVRYNVRSLAVRKATTVATAFGVALVVFVLACALMLAAGVKRTLGTSGHDDVAIVMRKGSNAEMGSAVEDPSISTILAQPGIKMMDGNKPLGAPEVVVVLALPKLGTPGLTNVTVRGVSDASYALRPTVKITKGRPARPGSNEVVIGERIEGRFEHVELGQQFDLRKNRPVTVVGVFTDNGSSQESEVWADLDTLRSAFGREGAVSSVRVKLDSKTKLDAFRTAVEQDKRLGLSVMRETAYYDQQSEGLALFITIMGSVIAALFAIGAMLGAMITMYGAIANRQREIGTLRALGFSRTSILSSFLLEAILLTFIGGAVGALASLAMKLVSFSMINSASWSEVVFSFDPTPATVGTALAFAVGMGLLGGFFPALRASRVSPIAAMRG